ncbi:MAG: IspD/TarI family cytidylyltransferase, partial [Candidatus Zixiibacteriota bacterium]
TIAAFEKASQIDQIVVVVSEVFQIFVTQKVIDPYKFQKVSKVVAGGASRQESVLNALKSLSVSTSIVAIHDGVRALVRPSDIDRVVESATKHKAAILAVPVNETVKEVEGDAITRTILRDKIWLAQTPQAFEFKLILDAHQKSSNRGNSDAITDDSILIEQCGIKVKVIEPSSSNTKVTTPEDLAFVESVLKGLRHG